MWFKRNWMELLLAVLLTITTTTFLLINWPRVNETYMEETKVIEEKAEAEATEEEMMVVETEAIEVEETEETTETTEPEVVEEEKQEFFDEEIVYDIQYVNDGEVMPYALCTPSTANEDTPMPVIVWLHGLGQVGASEKSFMDYGLVKLIPNWELTNFNAYIICPQLKSSFNTGTWSNKNTEANLRNLLDKFFAEHNIDQDNVVVTGTSLGGQGTIYCAAKMADYFDRAVVFNGYTSNANCSEIEIPIIGYVGTRDKGEDINSINFMRYYFAKAVGEENFYEIKASHGDLFKVVFNMDEDGNGKSDVVEWMFPNLSETL